MLMRAAGLGSTAEADAVEHVQKELNQATRHWTRTSKAAERYL